jgi:hypothetical protein
MHIGLTCVFMCVCVLEDAIAIGPPTSVTFTYIYGLLPHLEVQTPGSVPPGGILW